MAQCGDLLGRRLIMDVYEKKVPQSKRFGISRQFGRLFHEVAVRSSFRGSTLGKDILSPARA